MSKMEVRPNRYCDWCGERFAPTHDHDAYCCANCYNDANDFADEIAEEEAIEDMRLDGDISGFFEEDSDDTRLVCELAGFPVDSREEIDELYLELGGEG